MAFSDWSTTASLNTTVGGISIAEGCPPSNLNNAEREMMAELRASFSTALTSFFAAPDLPTAIAALGALKSAGDTIDGNLIRDTAGPHLYHTNAAFTSGRVALTAVGAPDPFAAGPLPGDIWITGS